MFRKPAIQIWVVSLLSLVSPCQFIFVGCLGNIENLPYVGLCGRTKVWSARVRKGSPLAVPSLWQTVTETATQARRLVRPLEALGDVAAHQEVAFGGKGRYWSEGD